MSHIDFKCLINNKEYPMKEEQKNEIEEEVISYQNIKDIFYEIFYKNLINDENKKFLDDNNLFYFEKEDIIFENIAYFNIDVKGWINLNEEDYIKLDNLESTKILMEIRIKTIYEKNILNQFNDIKNKIENIDNKVYTNKKIYDDEEYNNSEIDIAVLTANPLVDKMDKNIRELRSMNDFNNITNTIVNVVKNSTKLINAEFYPLTKNNLKNVIFNKPKILHLIFKSTYIIPEKIEKK